MEFSKTLIIKLLIYFTIILLIYIIQDSVSEKLFDYSIDLIVRIQKNSSYFTMNMLKIAFEFSSLRVILPIYIVIFNYCTIHTTYILTLSYFLASYAGNLLKLSDLKPHPAWINAAIKPSFCQTNYASPSEHSIISFSFYLSLLHIIITADYIRNRYLLKLLFYSLSFIKLFAITVSLVVLGLYSIDQIIFGAIEGFLIYFLIFHIFEIQNHNFEDLYKKFKSAVFTCGVCIIYSLMIAKTVFLFKFHSYHNDAYKNYVETICERKPLYMKFEFISFGEMLNLLSCFGMQFGLYILTKFLIDIDESDSEKINSLNHWNQTSNVKCLIRCIITFTFVAFVTCVFYFIPSKLNIFVLLLCYFALFMLIIFTVLFSFGIYFFVRIDLASESLNHPKSREISVEEMNNLMESENKIN